LVARPRDADLCLGVGLQHAEDDPVRRGGRSLLAGGVGLGDRTGDIQYSQGLPERASESVGKTDQRKTG